MFSILLYSVSVLCGVIGTVIIKKVGLNKHIDLVSIMFYRGIFSCIILVIINKILYNKNPNPLPVIKKIKQFAIINKIYFFFVLIMSGLEAYLWHYANSYVPINDAIVISYFSAFLVSIISFIILREKFQWSSIFYMIVGIFAFILLYDLDFQNLNIGYYILVLDMLVAAISVVLTKKMSIMLNVYNVAMLKLFANVLIMLPFVKTFHISLIDVIFLLILSCISVIDRYTHVASYSISKSLTILQPVRFLSIVYSIILSYLILQEQIKSYQIYAAIIMILLNIINIFTNSRKKS